MKLLGLPVTFLKVSELPLCFLLKSLYEVVESATLNPIHLGTMMRSFLRTFLYNFCSVWHLWPAFLPGKSHGQRRLAGYSPWGCKEPDTSWLKNDTTSETVYMGMMLYESFKYIIRDFWSLKTKTDNNTHRYYFLQQLLKYYYWGFPGSPVVGTWYFHLCGQA